MLPGGTQKHIAHDYKATQRSLLIIKNLVKNKRARLCRLTRFKEGLTRRPKGKSPFWGYTSKLAAYIESVATYTLKA